MPEKSSEFWELMRHLLAWAWVPALAAWGGAIRYFREGQAFSFWRFAGELSTSAFVGVVTGVICQASGFSALTTAACVGISGHAGGVAIIWLQKWVQNKLGVAP